MKPLRQRQFPQSEKTVCSPLQGTCNRRRSEILLSHTRSDLRSADQASSQIKDLRSRRVISFPSYETGALKDGVFYSKNGGILRSSEIECTPSPHSDGVGERHCDGSSSLGKIECRNEAMKTGIGLEAVPGEKVDHVQNSRLKLYWNSNSHCYRRLLPFLKDITTDNSGTLEILPCQNRFANLHKFPREGFVETVDTLCSQQDAKAMDFLQDKHPVNGQFSSQDSEKEVLNFSTDSSQDTGELVENKSTKDSCNGQSTGEIVKDSSIILEGSVRNNENADNGVRAEHKADKSVILEHSTNKSDGIGAIMMDSFMELGSSVSNGQDTRVTFPKNTKGFEVDATASISEADATASISEADATVSISEADATASISEADATASISEADATASISEADATASISEADATASISEAVEKHYLATPTTEILSPVRCSTISPLKGILKREKRKCRGACTCLKCASFVLNAEKTFEFSKMQLLDAESVALGLMKELSFIRKIVVDSTNPFAGPEARSILDHNQVQAICRRSSRAEQLARSQLKKMTSDLEIHCSRATKSRVSFADSVEERIFTQ